MNVTHDPLPWLPVPLLFGDRLRLALSQAKRYQRRFALLLIDLDHLDHINDALGPAAGEQLLVEAAWRLVSSVRESDSVARLNDDGFAIVLADMSAEAAEDRIARRIAAQLTEPYYLDVDTARISCSMGLAWLTEQTPDIERWERNAVSALQTAKAAGPNACHVYTSSAGCDGLL